ncbi:MAG: nucleotidyltransferase family protein [Oscillospiraceae bacterium]|nr:nucleotidyltransferase family protein [Oscillospiraceae bacterium]
MKPAIIIAEYNPFHNGHKYHIEQTRALTGATHVVAIMSGNFTQRGDTAIVPKHIRARAAVAGGADLVIELPVAFALSSAEQFALGAVRLANALCDNVGESVLSFGSECGELNLLEEAAGAVTYAATTDDFFGAMKRGKSYPAALQAAVEEHYSDDVVQVLASPNNTLGVEYLKALSETGSRIKPFTIPRIGAGHDEQLTVDGGVASAMQIRSLLLSGKAADALTPMEFGQDTDFADIKRLEIAILSKLRTMSPKDIRKAPNVGGGLENRLFNGVRLARNLNELHCLAKTKRYTLARIRRAVLCCFLGITQSDVKLGVQYVRILAMNSRGKELISAASAGGCPLPIDTSAAALSKKNDSALRQAALEDRCTNIYGLAFEKPLPCGREFTEKPIISDGISP